MCMSTHGIGSHPPHGENSPILIPQLFSPTSSTYTLSPAAWTQSTASSPLPVPSPSNHPPFRSLSAACPLPPPSSASKPHLWMRLAAPWRLFQKMQVSGGWSRWKRSQATDPTIIDQSSGPHSGKRQALDASHWYLWPRHWLSTWSTGVPRGLGRIVWREGKLLRGFASILNQRLLIINWNRLTWEMYNICTDYRDQK